MKRGIILILTVLLLPGCFFVVRSEDKIKVFGESKETALDAVKKTDETNPEEKREIINLFNK